MKRIGIFYGSSTGNTEAAAQAIQKALGSEADLFNVSNTPANKVSEYANLIYLGRRGFGRFDGNIY